jgi:DNA-binding NarL/FixJ family response regulator
LFISIIGDKVFQDIMNPERIVAYKTMLFKRKMAASVPVFDNEIITNQLSLTNSQFEIIQIFCSTGLRNDEIAILRGSSPGTIKSHFSDIYKKLNISGKSKKGSRIRLISYLIEQGALRYKPFIETTSFGILNHNKKPVGIEDFDNTALGK